MENRPQLFPTESDLELLLPIFHLLDFKTVIDADAGEGDFLRTFLDAGATQVFAFEPHPERFIKLRKKFLGERRVRVFDFSIDKEDRVAKPDIVFNPLGQHRNICSFEQESLSESKSMGENPSRSLNSLVADGNIPPRVGIFKTGATGGDVGERCGIGELSADLFVVPFRDDSRGSGRCAHTISEFKRFLIPHGYSNFIVLSSGSEPESLQITETKRSSGCPGRGLFIHDRIFPQISPVICRALLRERDASSKATPSSSERDDGCANVISQIQRNSGERLKLIHHLAEAVEERDEIIRMIQQVLGKKSGKFPGTVKLQVPSEGIAVTALQKCVVDVQSELLASNTEFQEIFLNNNRILIEKERIIADLAEECSRLRAFIEQRNASAVQRFLSRFGRSIKKRIVYRVVDNYWMQLGVLRQYKPREMEMERFPAVTRSGHLLPSIAIVTPSFMQGRFLERTILSVTSQEYPKLSYVVQDGGSKDGSVEVIKRHAAKLSCWESTPDGGQSDAIKRGFEKVNGEIMGWLNSDDMFMAGSLRYIGEYFARHPAVDAIYGHRVVIDDNDNEVGRWILPPHDRKILKWADYVPQETLFWRRSLWEKVGGVDTTFRFAVDWDLLIRFQKAGAKIVRLPYFMGCFRVHASQKTSTEMIASTGDFEMAKIRKEVHGRTIKTSELEPHVRRFRTKGVITAFMLASGIRY